MWYANYKRRASLFMKPSFYIFRGLIDFVYPPICSACENRTNGSAPLCRNCLKALRSSLAIELQSGKSDFTFLSGPLHFDGVYTGWNFSPELESLVHRVKYQGMKKLGRFLGKMTGRAFQSGLSPAGSGTGGIMVPVPLHKVRLRERGYNQSEWIAKGMGEGMGISVSSSILYRKKQTKTQTKLSAPEREKNVRDAFGAAGPEAVKGKTVFLVDDVITTGATLNACARCLKQAGAARVVGLALARPVKAVHSEKRPKKP
jgi:ComF family protein